MDVHGYAAPEALEFRFSRFRDLLSLFKLFPFKQVFPR